MKPINSPLRGWLGGKYRLAKTIVPLIPEHTCYAEVFAGAAWILMHKQPSKSEVLNDINADIINVYRCVKSHLPELLRQLEGMIPSRDEFTRLRSTNPDTLTDIQRAARFIYLHRLVFGGHINGSFAATVEKSPKFNASKLVDELALSQHQRLPHNIAKYHPMIVYTPPPQQLRLKQ